jgi:cytochrome c553
MSILLQKPTPIPEKNAMIKSMQLATFVVAGLASLGAAQADTHTRNISATCMSCHGTDGKSHSAIPGLAGLEKAYFFEQMKAFRDGKREATVMHQHAKGYTDAEFDAMAEYFAAIKN